MLTTALCLALLAPAAPTTRPMPAIAPPAIPDAQFLITDYGAVADGKTAINEAVKKALDAAAAAGGGHVVIPAGRFLANPLALASHIDLHLDAGATILAANDIASYPLKERGYVDFLTADGCTDVSITGEGTIDGQGQPWWERFEASRVPGGPPLAHRPYLVVLNNCQRVRIADITLTNSPSFHLVPRDCDDLTIDHVTFAAPEKAHNTDAMDPSGHRMLITRCHVDVGDDNIAFKPNRRRADGSPSTQDVLVTDCTFIHGHGLSIGGQTPGGMENLVVRHCTFEHTDAGIRLKAGRGQGGLVENLFYEDLTMTAVKVPIYITSYYPENPKNVAAVEAMEMTPRTPVWRNVLIRNVTITDSPETGRIWGLPEAHIQNITFDHITSTAATGMKIVFADDIRFEGSTITPQKGPALIVEKSTVSGMESK